MCLRSIVFGFVILLAGCISGCGGGGNDPVNEGKERPQQKKDK